MNSFNARACVLATLALLLAPAPAPAQSALVLSTCNAQSGTPLPPACSAVRGDRAEGWLAQSRAEVMARNGVVSTSHPLAAQAGLRILQQGGNAVDAAVAAAAVLNVVEPQSAGIGGDMFAIVYVAKEHRLIGINASGWSPTGATPARLKAQGYDAASGMPEFGILTVDVPGAVDGWDQLLRRAGTMDFRKVLQPAVELAEQGFPWSQRVAAEMADTYTYNKQVRADPDTLDTYYPHGALPAPGVIFRNPGLARAFRALQKHGRDAFYQGEIARAIVAKSNALGGTLTAADLADFHAEWVTPLSTSYHGFDVYELPPNGQGFAVLEELNLLEACVPRLGFELAKLGPASPDYWHLLVETKKIAFADLDRYNADPRFARVPIEKLISKDYAAAQCARIDMAHASAPASQPQQQGGTVYITAADRWGNMVSFIYSVYDALGSGITVPGYGFVLQDRGALFSLDPASPNLIAPRKRPFHTIIPAFVMKDGQPLLAFGLMGGSMQAQGHMQVLVDMIDLGANLQLAGDAARFNHSQDNNTLELESQLYDLLGAQLAARGHKVRKANGDDMGGFQAILHAATPAGDYYRAGSDHRKDGGAVGW
ncbi:MAG: gamma-glutamyltransferase [Gammaproteobacteria bacterium]|nr:gamma-glutamyltransferase [Gammaproteobacteria bacterium]MDE2250975.1 gamma-glutamyltransferase [Gammaproteobacteria bacterium]